MISFFNKYLGWRNWAVFYYNSIFENLFVIFYIALINNDFSTKYIGVSILFLIFSMFSTSYGYLINDLADLELDKAHGKSNTFNNDSLLKGSIVVIAFLLTSALLAIPFYNNKFFLFIWGIWIFLATFYSLKPLRFKESGRIGLIIVVLAQRLLPILILFAAFEFYDFPDFLILSIYLFLRGLTSDMSHQLMDYENDIKTNTSTSAVVLGKKKYKILFNIALELEKLYLIFLIIWISGNIEYFGLFDISGITCFAGLILLLNIFELYFSIKKKRIENPYDSNKNLNQVILLLIPNILLPVLLLLKLVNSNQIYFIYFIIIILIFRLFSWQVIKNSIVIKYLFKYLRKSYTGNVITF